MKTTPGALLEISAWPWLERLSRAEGRVVTLGDVPPAAWDAVAAWRVDALYLMGVWRRSGIGRAIARAHAGLRSDYDRVLPGWQPADVPGSPYSISDYAPATRMGGWRGLDTARRELRARGLDLILDFVPNHTGHDHPWVAAHPERYVLGSDEETAAAPGHFRRVKTRDGRVVHVACGRDPYFDPWTDVAQLNYFNGETREAMIGELRRIAAHCDGVRCDMAMLPLNDVFSRTWGRLVDRAWPRPPDEFWPVAIRAVPGLTYMAEVYWDLEGTMLDQGFHVAYDKRLLDALTAGDAGARVRALLAASHPPHGRLAKFIENHDEPRSAAALEGRVEAAAALTATLPGCRFFFDGQAEGRRVRVPVQLGRWPDEPVDERLRAIYSRIMTFGSADVLRRGEWTLLEISPAGDDSSGHLVAYRWRTAHAHALVVVNLGPVAAQGFVRPPDGWGTAATLDFTDGLTDACYRWTREALEREGLYVRLDAGSAHLFTVT